MTETTSAYGVAPAAAGMRYKARSMALPVSGQWLPDGPYITATQRLHAVQPEW